jgi:hypothetical protein
LTLIITKIEIIDNLIRRNVMKPAGTVWDGISTTPITATKELNSYGDQIWMKGSQKCVVYHGSVYDANQAPSMHDAMRRNASKDLYEALNILVLAYDDELGGLEWENAKKAIAKARGEIK